MRRRAQALGTTAVLLSAVFAVSILAAQPCQATRATTAHDYDLRGSYFGSFEKHPEAARKTPDDDPAFVLPTRRDPHPAPREGEEKASGTAVMCLCESEETPLTDDGALEFNVEGVVAFLQNDKVGHKFPLRGLISCPPPVGRGHVQGASHALCHYVSTSEEAPGYDLTLELDAAKSLQPDQPSSSHVAFFNISTKGASSGYSGYIGSKLSALDSVCDDIACRKVTNYVVNSKEEELPKEEETIAMPPPPPAAAPEQPARQEDQEQDQEQQGPGLYTAGRDGSLAKNPVGKLRCGGSSEARRGGDLKPQCGDQGFCMDEMTGAACYWDCDPGWCACTAGTCFDAEGKCTIQATYPASNNYQATCDYNGPVVEQPEESGKSVKSRAPPTSTTSTASAVSFDTGFDGAKPLNRVQSLRCGGEKGKPSCGDMGFCLDEVTGDRCFWDCDPGWCSCNSGACFDAAGRCTEAATYPESNNWQATCDVSVLSPSSGGDTSGPSSSQWGYTAGKDGARPPNRVGKKSCGGTKGKPECGIQGYCMDAQTGDNCYWDCDPGWCSCTPGTCFDRDGDCTLPASYPQSNNWQATCPYY